MSAPPVTPPGAATADPVLSVPGFGFLPASYYSLLTDLTVQYDDEKGLSDTERDFAKCQVVQHLFQQVSEGSRQNQEGVPGGIFVLRGPNSVFFFKSDQLVMHLISHG